MSGRRGAALSLSLAALFTLLSAAAARGRQETGSVPPPPAAPPQGMSVGSPAVPPGVPTALPPPLPQGPAADLALVFTNHVIGWIEPCG